MGILGAKDGGGRGLRIGMNGTSIGVVICPESKREGKKPWSCNGRALRPELDGDDVSMMSSIFLFQISVFFYNF